ncbi:MAG TPA: hypothetical protein VMB80_14680 [Candidatus Acidoferrum sp.]|nr:hypothetical protein [Candidatus Acidoferrum sp.]
MNAWFLPVICALTLPLCGRAEDAPRAEQIERLVRDFAFDFNPNLNTNTDFKIRKLEVARLWEDLKVQVFDIEYLSRGQWFNGFVGIYHDEKISSLAPTVGGYGLMSGLMNNGDFYYTYSWGSGIHRSHVAKLRVVDGKLKSWDSGGFEGQDLFVTGDSKGKVRVLSGEFKEFNRWDAAKDIGFVGMTNTPQLQIIGPTGEVIAPTFPYRIEKSQPDGAANGSQPIRSETNRTSSAAGSRR